MILFFKVARLDNALEKLQMNLASSHQKHKTEVLKLEEFIKGLEQDVNEARRHSKAQEQELLKRDDIIARKQAEIKATEEQVASRVEEVERLEGGLREIKVELGNSQHDCRQTQNQVCDRQI